MDGYPGSVTGRVPVVRRSDYTISLEMDGGATFVHSEVQRWSVAVARAWRRDMDAVLELHGGPIYAMTRAPHGGDWNKWRKFVALVGFRFHAAVTVADGTRHSIYVRDR